MAWISIILETSRVNAYMETLENSVKWVGLLRLNRSIIFAIQMIRKLICCAHQLN